MKFSLAFFLGLASLVCSCVLASIPKSCCKDVSPEVYCTSKKQENHCPREHGFCERYLRRPICRRGPEVYCRSKEIAEYCKKEAFCLTWPSDHVTAVKIKHEEAYTPFPLQYLEFLRGRT